MSLGTKAPPPLGLTVGCPVPLWELSLKLSTAMAMQSLGLVLNLRGKNGGRTRIAQRWPVLRPGLRCRGVDYILLFTPVHV